MVDERAYYTAEQEHHLRRITRAVITYWLALTFASFCAGMIWGFWPALFAEAIGLAAFSLTSAVVMSREP